MSRNRPNQLFLSKIYVVALFGCHTKCILYHYLQTGDYLRNKAIRSAFKESVVFLKLETSVSFDELCNEFYAMNPSLALCLIDEFVLNPYPANVENMVSS